MAGSADLVIRVLADTSGATGELSKLSGTLGKALGIGAGALGAGVALQAATDWQAAMARIAIAYNDVNFTSGNARFEEVQTYLRNLSTQLPTTAADLASIYEVAARYAPDSTQKAEEFTTAVAGLVNVSRDLNDPTSSAQDLAQFLRIFNDTNAAGVGSAIAQLSTLHTQGEGPVLQMAQSLALAGNQFGLTEAQVLGFSNVLVDVLGNRAQMAGASLTRMFLEMGQASAAAADGIDADSKKIRDATQRAGDLQAQLAIAEQRRSQMYGQHGLKTAYRRDPAAVMSADNEIRRLQEELSNSQQDLASLNDPQNASRARGQRININEAAKLAGVSVSDFTQQFNSDPFGAFMGVLGGLKGLSGTEQETALGQLGIKNIRDVMDIGALVTRLDQIGPTVAAAQSQIDNPTTLPTQTGIVANTTAAKLAELHNAATDTAQIIGEPLRRELDQGLTAILDSVQRNGFGPLEDAMNKFDVGVGAASAALALLTNAVGANTVVQTLSAGAGGLRMLGGAGGSSGGTTLSGGYTSLPGGTYANQYSPIGAVNFLAAGANVAGALAVSELGSLLANGSLDAALNGGLGPSIQQVAEDHVKTQQQAADTNKVQIGDITIHAGSPLQDVIAAVTAHITAAWNSAQSSQPVTGQIGGSYTTGNGPR